MVKKINAAITGVHCWVPDYILTNEELMTMVDTSDEWITSRTGIKERHILKGENLGASYLGVKAVKGLLEKKNISPDEIDLLMCCTATPDVQFPATANIISHEAGIKNAFSFDIMAACSGFLYAMDIAEKYIQSGRYKKVMIVAAEKMSSITDYTDRSTCILFGDAGAAVLLEPTEEEVGITDTILKTDGVGYEFLHMKAGGSRKPATHQTIDAKEHYIYQEGQAVFKFAVTRMADVAEEVLIRNNMKTEDIKWLVPHQANKRIIDATYRRLKIPLENVMINIQKYGNTTTASIPLCLWEWEKELKKGDNMVLAAFGGGFTWGASLIKWAYDS